MHFESVAPGSTLTREAVLAGLRDARFSGGLRCPHCGHSRIHRWGCFSGRQRYKCLGCRRTFSDLTGTPAAYLKKVELLPAYSRCLFSALSVRRSALQVGIDPSTAFRWRHRMCAWLRDHQEGTVSGCVEVATFWLRESRKGERGLDRAPHRRGIRVRAWYRRPRFHVVSACDRRGNLVSGLARNPSSDVTAQVLHAALLGRLRAPLYLTSTHECGHASARWARSIGADHARSQFEAGLLQPSPRARRHPPLAHCRTIWHYRKRLAGWLWWFRGVATKYLPNYLAWHRWVDTARKEHFDTAVLRWPMLTP